MTWNILRFLSVNRILITYKFIFYLNCLAIICERETVRERMGEKGLVSDFMFELVFALRFLPANKLTQLRQVRTQFTPDFPSVRAFPSDAQPLCSRVVLTVHLWSGEIECPFLAGLSKQCRSMWEALIKLLMAFRKHLTKLTTGKSHTFLAIRTAPKCNGLFIYTGV